MSITRACLLTVLVALAAAAPSGAVVGGEPVAPESVPWLAEVARLRRDPGGARPRPHRRALRQERPARRNIAGVLVGTEQRHGTRFALHPGWRHANGPKQRARRRGHRPARRSGHDRRARRARRHPRRRGVDPRPRPPVRAGHGPQREGDPQRQRPAPGGPAADQRQAVRGRMEAPPGQRRRALRRRPDAVRHRRRRPRAAELGLQRRQRRPALHGHGQPRRCCSASSAGAARAAAPTTRRRSSPRSRATATSSPIRRRRGRRRRPRRPRSRARAGSAASSPAPSTGYTARPTKVEVQWQRQGGRKPKNVGHARTYKVTKADAGHPLVCSVTASNDGGISTAPFAPTSMVKIPR